METGAVLHLWSSGASMAQHLAQEIYWSVQRTLRSSRSKGCPWNQVININKQQPPTIKDKKYEDHPQEGVQNAPLKSTQSLSASLLLVAFGYFVFLHLHILYWCILYLCIISGVSHFQLNSGELLPVGQNIWYLDLGANIDWTTRRRLLPRNSQFSIPSSQKHKFSILYSIFTKTLNTSHHVLYPIPHIKRFGRLVLTNGLQYSCNAYLIEEANFRINAKKIFQIFIEK